MGRLKRSVQLAVGLLISVAFLWFAFRDVAFADVWARMRTANLWGVAGIAAAGVLGIVSRAQRWVLLFPSRWHVTVKDAFVAQAIGYAGNGVLPFRAGEALKAYSISQRGHVPFTTVLATVVLERVFDLIGVGMLLGLAMALVPIPESAGPQVNAAVRVLGLVAFATVGVIVAFVFLRDRMLRVVDGCIAWLPGALREHARVAAHSFVEGLDAMGDARQLVRVLAMTAYVWATLALPYMIGSWALGFDGRYGAPGWQVGIVCGAIVAVFVMIPAAPGFVGTYQAGCIVALAVFSVPREDALGFSLLLHFVSMAPPTIIGLVLALQQGLLGGGPPRPPASGEYGPDDVV